MSETPPTLQGLEEILNEIASDSRISPEYASWIRSTLQNSGLKIRILKYALAQSTRPDMPCELLDVGAQFAALATYAARLGMRAAAIDFGPTAGAYSEIAVAKGVDYKICDLQLGQLPFSDGSFDFVTYTDVLEHHAFSPKRVLNEIHRVLRPGGHLIVVTPNHASIYNRIKLLFGMSVNDDLQYFFATCAADDIYDGHHREYTCREVKSILESTHFRVPECRAIDLDVESLRYYSRHRLPAAIAPSSREFALRRLGSVWQTLHLPFGRWIWVVGEKI